MPDAEFSAPKWLRRTLGRSGGVTRAGQPSPRASSVTNSTPVIRVSRRV